MALTHGGNIFAIARQYNWDWRDIVDFSASINPLGPSEHVAKAIRGSMDRIVHYPDCDSTDLRAALAEKWQVREDCILPGNGATELIYFLGRIFRNTPVTLALPVFSEFARAFPSAGTADLTNPGTWPSQGVLIVTRPANPTGYTVPLEQIEWWLKPGRTLVVDESFLDFTTSPSALSLLRSCGDVVVLNSLTKFYALPGLRIGALVTSGANVAEWQPCREPWQVNVLAERAAIAAIRDTAHAHRTRAFVDSERRWLMRELQTIRHIVCSSGDVNFIHVHLRYAASELCAYLLAHKILIRNCTGWPGINGESVRVAVRLRDQNEILLKAWRSFPCA